MYVHVYVCVCLCLYLVDACVGGCAFFFCFLFWGETVCEQVYVDVIEVVTLLTQFCWIVWQR